MTEALVCARQHLPQFPLRPYRIWDLSFGSMLLGRFDEREGKLYAAFYAHRPWHRGGRAGRVAEGSTQEDFHDFHRATTTR